MLVPSAFISNCSFKGAQYVFGTHFSSVLTNFGLPLLFIFVFLVSFQLIRSLEVQSQASHLQAIKELEQNEKKGLKMQKYVNSKGTMVAILDREQAQDSFHTEENEPERRQSFANAISENFPMVELGTEYDSIDENESRQY